MTIKMGWTECCRIVELAGRDAFLKKLQELFPELELYKFSLSWLESKEFICKAKGTSGDLIIQWI